MIDDAPDTARVAGPAAAGLTRLALSSYDIWRDIFSTNAAAIDGALGAFIARLEELRAALREPRSGLGLKNAFERAARAASNLTPSR